MVCRGYEIAVCETNAEPHGPRALGWVTGSIIEGGTRESPGGDRTARVWVKRAGICVEGHKE